MSNIAIRAEGIGKAYQLGEFSTGTLSRDIERWWAKRRGKEDAFLTIGEDNDRTSKGKSDIVWSLQDINFDINQGDAVGIIGRNGAGKSTLLKVLSRVTSPTTGSIKLKGRIASLLEVGTGFHPELTGRENIYLNGAILGMRKLEIKKHFDEIVDFAGVQRYVDTPVKRYSSGMYVRLAFAVAAYLESEILIVDEVLAVGDAEFQKKCLGKMNEVSKGEGRTILFVSHNMAAVKQLCTKGIILKNGKLDYTGTALECISQYNDIGNDGISFQKLIVKRHSFLLVDKIIINDRQQSPVILQGNMLNISLSGTCFASIDINLEVLFFSNENVLVSCFSPGQLYNRTIKIQEGHFEFTDNITFPDLMANGEYYADISLSTPNVEVFFQMKEVKIIKDDLKSTSGRAFDYNEVGFFMME